MPIYPNLLVFSQVDLLLLTFANNVAKSFVFFTDCYRYKKSSLQ